MHTAFALLCFVVVIHWLIFPYPSDLLHWHCGNPTIAPVPAKQPWWIWIKTSCEFIMNDCITTTKQSTTKPCAYFLGYTVGITGFSRKCAAWHSLIKWLYDIDHCWIKIKGVAYQAFLRDNLGSRFISLYCNHISSVYEFVLFKCDLRSFYFNNGIVP